MSENWSSIAAEVDAALRSVGVTDGGYPVALRKVMVTGAEPGDPASGSETITYHGLVSVENVHQLRDINGTVIGETVKTLLVNATGAVPTIDDKVAPGVTEGDAGEGSNWLTLLAVRPLSPAGVAVLYEIDVEI